MKLCQGLLTTALHT